MGVAVDRTPDVDLNEEPCKLNSGRHMGRRGPEFTPLSLFLHMLICISSVMKSPHLSKDQLQHRVLGDSSLATASKQTDSSPLWCKMRSKCVRKKAGNAAMGFKQNLQCNRGHFVFLWRRGERGIAILPTRLPKQMENISCSLSCNNLIPVCRGCSATTHHSEYLHTFLLPICSLSFTPYLFLLAIFFSFLLATPPASSLLI